MKHECDNCKYWFFPATRSPCDNCLRSGDEYSEWTAQTNADRIRSMTDEELGEWLLKNAACPCAAMNGGCALNDDTCRQAWLEWLKEEVKDDQLQDM